MAQILTTTRKKQLKKNPKQNNLCKQVFQKKTDMNAYRMFNVHTQVHIVQNTLDLKGLNKHIPDNMMYL